MLNPQKLLMILIGSSMLCSIATSDGLSPTYCPVEHQNFTLNLTGVGLKALPDEFLVNEFLTHLILDDNHIPSVSVGIFSSVLKLIYLSLANNKLNSIELSPFSQLERLDTLILNGNCKLRAQVDSSPLRYAYMKPRQSDANSFCNLQFNSYLPNLTHLFAEDSNIQKLVFSSEKLPALTHLYLSNNPLEMNKETISNLKEFLPALTHLYLDHSNIVEFDLSQLRTVRSLFLDKNEIRSICNEYCGGSALKLKEASNLETLSVSRNEIIKIEVDAFNYTTNLTTLDLSHNRISEIREGTFDKLYLLQYLSLEDNNIATLTAIHTFRSLVNLESLYLGYNNVSAVTSGTFENLIALETLFLNHNRLSSLELGTFSNLKNLRELSLADNQLSSISKGSMPSSGSLMVLNLDSNWFTSLEDISVVNAPRMITLSLKDNPLTGVTSRWFASVPAKLNIILGSSCFNKNDTWTATSVL